MNLPVNWIYFPIISGLQSLCSVLIFVFLKKQVAKVAFLPKNEHIMIQYTVFTGVLLGSWAIVFYKL